MKVKLKKFWDSVGFLIVPVVAAIILSRVVFGLYRVPTTSMEPTIHAGSVVVSWSLPYLIGDPEPDYGDVVVFNSEELGCVLLKRVVGLPGDEISFSEGYVFRNGERLEEPYLPDDVATECDESFKVPEGCFFAMGDNRRDSADCRQFDNPYIPIECILGQELFPIQF